MLETLSFRNTLERGFVVVRDAQNKPVTSADKLRAAQEVTLEFKEDQKVNAVVKGCHSGNKPVSKKQEQDDQERLL